jgi:hypothetical protein
VVATTGRSWPERSHSVWRCYQTFKRGRADGGRPRQEAMLGSTRAVSLGRVSPVLEIPRAGMTCKTRGSLGHLPLM